MTRSPETVEWVGRVAAAVCVAATLTLVGCAAENTDETVAETKLLDYAQVQSEYRDATLELDPPAGYQYPATFDAAEGELYEAGYGEARAVTSWNCAWGIEWLRLRTEDPSTADAALDAYASVEDTEVFKTRWDPASIQQPFRESIERAKLGDPSLIQSDVQANCP